MKMSTVSRRWGKVIRFFAEGGRDGSPARARSPVTVGRDQKGRSRGTEELRAGTCSMRRIWKSMGMIVQRGGGAGMAHR